MKDFGSDARMHCFVLFSSVLVYEMHNRCNEIYIYIQSFLNKSIKTILWFLQHSFIIF